MSRFRLVTLSPAYFKATGGLLKRCEHKSKFVASIVPVLGLEARIYPSVGFSWHRYLLTPGVDALAHIEY